MSILLLGLVLAACAPLSTRSPVSTVTQVPTDSDPIVPPIAATVSPVSATPALPLSPTFTASSLPDSLVVAYIVEDALWLWEGNQSRLLLQRPQIFGAQLSQDGQWLIFQQRHNHPDGSISSMELWALRTDGSELHRLLDSDQLSSQMGGEDSLFISDIGWMPGGHTLLFNTEKVIEGPPERWPVFDLFLLDLSGHLTRLAEPGLGGRFVPSPDGAYVSVATDSKIGIITLQNGAARTLLEFPPLQLGCECIAMPRVVWDPESQYVLAAIPPEKLHYPEEYAGEPEQVWRLSVKGKAEVVAQWKPIARVSGITTDPDLRHFLYLQNSCTDAMGMLTVHDLASGTESALFCIWELPQWAPDGEHFIFNWDGLWRVASVSDTTAEARPLDVLNVPTDPDVHDSPDLIWIDDQYFLLTIRSNEACRLSVATLDGIVAEIAHTAPDACPRADFSLFK